MSETPVSKPSLYGINIKEAAEFFKSQGLPTYRAKQLLDWLYKKHITAVSEAKNIPGEVQKKLAAEFEIPSLELVEKNSSAEGESIKFLFRTRDGRLIESVLIEQQGRRTLCVSTQVGCKIGCVFCASGKGKFGRNLSAGEIVEQAAYVERERKAELTNVVYMGMGEPLDNFEATMKSLEILQASWGFGIGARRITVSTSGITPKIVEFVNRSEGRVRLSVSLHAGNEEKRTALVPINKKYSLKELVAALNEIHHKLKRDITFEYTMLAGINDSSRDAGEVARIAVPLRAKVNLIPYNPIFGEEFKTPSKDKIEAFAQSLEEKGIRVIVRQTAGRDINAACGQLRLLREDPPAQSENQSGV